MISFFFGLYFSRTAGSSYDEQTSSTIELETVGEPRGYRYTDRVCVLARSDGAWSGECELFLRLFLMELDGS